MESLTSVLKDSYPTVAIESSSAPSAASVSIFPDADYTDTYKENIDHWSAIIKSIPSPDVLRTLNEHLASRTTILGSKPSVADILAYTHIAPLVAKWTREERTGINGYHHIVRHLDFVQNSPLFKLNIREDDKININPDDIVHVIPPIDAKAEKERKKKEKELAAGDAKVGTVQTMVDKIEQGTKQVKDAVVTAVAGGAEKVEQNVSDKKAKTKEKAPKPAKEAPKAKALSPSLIDLRVGHILEAIEHPNATSLFISTIDMGDPEGTENTSLYKTRVIRKVCSGLNGKIPLEAMQNRKVVVVCNLKPVTMRGEKSCAMVLAASPRPADGAQDSHGEEKVELVIPPANSQPGDRVYFEGWEGEPEPVLNPKKKIFETFQPGFLTTGELQVGFSLAAVLELLKENPSASTKVALLRTKDGVCTVETLKDAIVR